MARLLPKRSASRLVWNGNAVSEKAETLAKRVMVKLMVKAEKESKRRLKPGRGVETSTMRNRTHVAPGGHGWSSEHIEPVAGGGPDLASGGDIEPSKIRGKWSLELGCGQRYAIFYHQKHDAFIRIPFGLAMKTFKEKVNAEWQANFQ